MTIDEIEKIEAIQLEKDTPICHTKNVWLIAFYFAGIRISDMVELKWSDIIDGRLYYPMNKNEKPVSLKVPNQAFIILDLYRKDKKSNDDDIFPFLKKANPKSPEDIFTKARNATKLFNKFLKRIAKLCGIEKNLSNHIARHSDLKTTIGYQANFIHKEADDALEQVLNS